MRRALVVLIALAALAPATRAGGFEDEIKSRWLGAWVVLRTESYSDCGGLYTNNRVNGTLVRGQGDRRFQAGELAKLDKLDTKRSRVDLLLTLAEPLLVDYAEGPFTLYREAECRVELEVEIPREVVKSKDVDAVEQALTAILERYSSEEAAKDSGVWNRREREAYPDDYDETLARLGVWRAEQANARVQARLDEARETTYRLPDRVSGDADYLDGFARGVESAKASDVGDCARLLAIDLDHPPGRVPESNAADEASRERTRRGFQDGQVLVYGMEMLRRLPECFVPVPETTARLVEDARD